jgi:hypothetical protein
MNYFTCTANLGVVPLFLSAAFLLAPIFLCLFLRRFSVIPVLEAINLSPKQLIQLSTQFLTLVTQNVKKMMLIFLIIFTNRSMAIDIILAKGEQKELFVQNLSNYSVGNREIIATRIISKGNKLLIKGSKIGFSDLIVWQNKTQIEYKIYVLSKANYLKTLQIAESLKDLSLVINLKGPIIEANGTIERFDDYIYLNQLKKKYRDYLFLKITLNANLRNYILKNVYKSMFKNGFSHTTCSAELLEITCHYEGDNKNIALLKDLEERYAIRLIEMTPINKSKNFRIRMKILQFEQSDGREASLGLYQLRAKVEDLFQYGLSSLISQNIVALADSSMKASTLAEPEYLITIDHSNMIEVGAQIPFQNIGNSGSAIIAPIDWRFAGLKVKTTLKNHLGKLLIDYETEFTKPQEKGISGSKEQSSLIVEPGVHYKAFQIGYKAENNEKSTLPGMLNVPILATLFGSNTTTTTFKKIEGYIVLEEID